MSINLNNVKSIKQGTTEINQLKIGNTVVWKKQSINIAVNNIVGGKEIAFTRGDDPLKHTLWTKTTAGGTFSSSTTSYEVKTASSGTASAKIADDSGNNIVAEASQDWSVSAATAPTIASTNYLSGTTGGKTFTLTNNMNSGTLQYKIGSGSWTNYSSAFTVTSANTIYARVINVTGYSDSGNATDSVTACTAPTITVSNIAGGKSISISVPTGTTVVYSYSGTPDTSTSTAVSTNKTTVSSGTAQAFAYKSGFANSSAAPQAWSVTQLGDPTISVTNITGGKTISISKSTNATGIVYNYNGTPSTTSTSNVSTNVTSALSGTARAYAYADGYVSSSTAEQAWSVTQLAAPTITVSNITSGKSISISKPTNANGIYYDYNTSETPATNSTTAVSTNKTTASSGTAKAYAYGSGYANSSIASQDWSVTTATASISVSNIISGKKVTIINNAGSGTLHYLYSGSTWSTSTTPPVMRCDFKTVTSGTAKAYVTGASGYADGSTTAGNAEQAWSVSRVSNPAWSTSNITSGKTLTLSRPSGISNGTLQYKINSDSWTTYSAAFNQTSAATVYGRLINVPGYADSLETASTSVGYYSPTVSAVNSSSGGKYYSITKAAAGTLHYTVSGGLVVSETTTTATTAQTTGNWTNTTLTTCNAWCTGMSGYADASSSVGNNSVSETLTDCGTIADPTITDIPNGKKATWIAPSNCTLTTTTESITETSPAVFTTRAYRSGYASVDKSYSVTVDQAAAPTYTITEIRNGKRYAVSSTDTGTLQYSTNSGSTWTTFTSPLSRTGSAQTIIFRVTNVSGKRTSSSSTSDTIYQISTPTVASNGAAIVGGKQTLFNIPTTTTSGASLSGTASLELSGGTGTESGTTVLMKSVGTFTPKATAYKDGYADSAQASGTSIYVDYLTPSVYAVDGSSGKAFRIRTPDVSSELLGTTYYKMVNQNTGTTLDSGSFGTGKNYYTTYTIPYDADGATIFCSAWVKDSIGYADGSSSQYRDSDDFTLSPCQISWNTYNNGYFVNGIDPVTGRIHLMATTTPADATVYLGYTAADRDSGNCVGRYASALHNEEIYYTVKGPGYYKIQSDIDPDVLGSDVGDAYMNKGQIGDFRIGDYHIYSDSDGIIMGYDPGTSSDEMTGDMEFAYAYDTWDTGYDLDDVLSNNLSTVYKNKYALANFNGTEEYKQMYPMIIRPDADGNLIIQSQSV